MQKGKLLIIDDEERLRNLLARILQLEGHEVITPLLMPKKVCVNCSRKYTGCTERC
jgi:CheY-like chemotaxis protein